MEAGADINATCSVARTSHGAYSALSLAVRAPDPVEIMTLLINLGADVNLVSKGVAPILAAVWYGYWEVFEFLLDSGANVNVCNNIGDTPLHAAVETDVLRHRFVVRLIGKGANINARNDEGQTPLLKAFLRYNLKAVSLLVEAGADPDLEDRSGQSPRSLARKHNYSGKCLGLLQAET